MSSPAKGARPTPLRVGTKGWYVPTLKALTADATLQPRAARVAQTKLREGYQKKLEPAAP